MSRQPMWVLSAAVVLPPHVAVSDCHRFRYCAESLECMRARVRITHEVVSLLAHLGRRGPNSPGCCVGMCSTHLIRQLVLPQRYARIRHTGIAHAPFAFIWQLLCRACGEVVVVVDREACALQVCWVADCSGWALPALGCAYGRHDNRRHTTVVTRSTPFGGHSATRCPISQCAVSTAMVGVRASVS